MCKKIVFLFILSVYFVFSFCVELMILHTNDHHGSLFNYWNEFNEVAGIAERAHIIKQITADQENFLILDAGDINTGIYESNIFDAEPDIIAYNMIGYDAVTLGNHEFYGGLHKVQKQIQWADFPMLSANITNLEGEYIGQPYTIFNMPNGLNVAILGLTTTHKKLHSDFVVKDDVQVAMELVPLLREKADVVIALTHLGIYDFSRDTLYGSIRLATNVSGIDMIIDGDSHTLLNEPVIVNGTPIVQVGHRGRYLGKALLNFDVATGMVDLTSWEAIPLMRDWDEEPFEADINISEMLGEFKVKSINAGNELIGYTTRNFRQVNKENRIIALGRVIGEAILLSAKEHGAEIGMINNGGIRSDLLEGEIWVSHVHNVLPFDDNVIVMDIPGTILLEIIRSSFVENTGTTAFLQYSNNVGIVQTPPDVVIPNLKGVEIQADVVYKVATNKYLSDGGDGYELFKLANSSIDTGISTKAAFIDYIKNTPFFQESE